MKAINYVINENFYTHFATRMFSFAKMINYTFKKF